MIKIPRKAYTFEFKQEAVYLVKSNQRVFLRRRVAFGMVEQTLSNRVKTHPAGKLLGSDRVKELLRKRAGSEGVQDGIAGCF